MAKKRKAKKRSQRTVVSTGAPKSPNSGPPTEQNVVAPTTFKPPKASPVKEQVAEDPRWSYVSSDIRRVGIIFALCILLEVAIWFLLNNTSLGESIFSLVKI